MNKSRSENFKDIIALYNAISHLRVAEISLGGLKTDSFGKRIIKKMNKEKENLDKIADELELEMNKLTRKNFNVSLFKEFKED